MVSYKEALATLMLDDRKSIILYYLEKDVFPFSKLKQVSGYEHNQSLTRSLRKLERLGLVHHTYRHGSAEVYSYYELSPFGRDVLEKFRLLEPLAPEKLSARRRAVRKILEGPQR